MRTALACLIVGLLSTACSEKPKSEPTTVRSLSATRAQFAALRPGERALAPIDGGYATAKSELADVRIPTRANAAITLTEARTGATLRIAPTFAIDREGVLEDDVVMHDLGSGRAMFVRATSAGFEDYVLLPAGSNESSLAWTVTLGEGVVGLRLIDNVLEAIDRTGTPRLHVSPPTVTDANGATHQAQLSVHGCAVDLDASMPWGRAPVDPGAASCTVRVSFASDLARPLLVDPAWQSTAANAVLRTRHTAVSFAAGTATRVLVAGGETTGGASLSSVEIYDPATSTWASVAAMAGARKDATGLYFQVDSTNHYAYVTGGRNGSTVLATSERYAFATGAWQNAGTHQSARVGHTLTRWGTQNIMAFGGVNGSGTRVGGEATNAGSAFWYGLDSPGSPRTLHAAIGFDLRFDGRGYCVMILGGDTNTGVTNTTQWYCDGVDDQLWRTGPNLGSARRHFAVQEVAAGKFLIAGGFNGTTDVASAEYLDPTKVLSTGFVSPASAMPDVLGYTRGAPLNATDMLVIGTHTAGLRSAVFHYDGGLGTWTRTGLLANAHTPDIVTLSGIGGEGLVVGSPGNPERWARRGNGTTCTEAGECATGFCVEGVCCNTTCTGTCQSCRATNKASGADGTCGPVKAGGSSAGKCTATGTSTCGTDGTCDGAGACRNYVSGTVCQAASCTGITELPARTCDGAGACGSSTAKSCATGYVCSGAACATSCTTDASCATGYHCNGGACVVSKADGSTCGRARECTSGNCVDGVCCESACGGACEACSAALKGFGVDGKCENVGNGTDPRNRCAADPGFPGNCKADGFCDGAGACRAFALAGTGCGTNTCASGMATYNKCNATGTCGPVSKTCAFGGCKTTADACEGDCVKDADCPTDAACDTTTNTCVGKLIDGSVATDPRACKSGIIADGLCCNAKCEGTCESCAESATKGTCVAVVGPAKHGMCAAATGGDACSATACDGTARDKCAGRPGAETGCRPASCSDGVQTLPTLCDGTGACPSPQTKKCEPFACGDKACKETCATTTDCADGYACDSASGKCSRGSTCKDEQTVISSDGVEKTCAPLRCAGQGCLTQCASTDDCVPGFVCEVSTKTCVAGASTEDSGGCSVAGAGARASAPLGLLLMLGLLRRRRSLSGPRR